MQEEEHHSLGEVHSFAERWRLSESNREHGARALEVSPPDPQLISKFQSLSQAASTLVILVGAFVLLGGILGFANMNTMRPGLAQLKAQTAVCFILAGISLRLLRKEASGRLARGVAQACALLVALLGLLTLVDKLFGWELGIDQWVLRPNVAGSAAHGPSRMALMIALNFFLLGCALLVLDVETRGGYRASQFLTMLAGLASWSVILDSTLNPALSYLYLALPTALLFGVLCTGVLLVRPDRGLVAILASQSLGGMTARRLLPAAFGISVILAWLRWEGERAGLYDREHSVVLSAAVHLVLLAGLIWWNARSLDRADAERRRAELVLRAAHHELEARVTERTADLAQANESLRMEITERKRAEEAASYLAAIVQSSEDAIIGKTLDGIIVSWNPGAERIYGYTAAEAIGRPISSLVPPEHEHELPEILGRVQRGERVDNFHTTRVKKNGEVLHISLTISPVRDAEGTIIGASAIARDISESTRAEQALQQANAVLTGWLHELEKRTRETTVLNEMGHLLQTCVSAEEAYAVIARSAQQLFPSDAGALCVLNASQNLVEAVAIWGQSLVGERVFAPEECWALRRGQVHAVEDPAPGLVCRHLGALRGLSYLCVPMMGQGEALGVLHVQSGGSSGEGQNRLTDAQQRLAVTAAGHIALALANLRLRETLRMQSIRDPLTGLFNRRYMEESLARELRRAARNQRRLGAIMLDLDRFKRFNDTFGHEAGDTLLRELGEFLRSRTRGEDIACRYGGEEFVVILPEASMEVTQQRAERLREEFKHLNVQHRGRSLGPVTLSVGVAVFPEHGSTAEEILRAADHALYQAKAEGRDRVALGAAAGKL